MWYRKQRFWLGSVSWLVLVLASEEIERSRKRNQKDGLNQNDITEGRSEIQKHIEIYLPIVFMKRRRFPAAWSKRTTL